MDRTEKSPINVEIHYLTILCTLLLLCVSICIFVFEDLGKNLIHQGIVNLECIILVVLICFLIHLEVQLCIDYGGIDNHLLTKVQEIMSRRDMCYLDVVPDNIGQLKSSNSSQELEIQHYVLHNFFQLFLSTFDSSMLSRSLCSSSQ